MILKFSCFLLKTQIREAKIREYKVQKRTRTQGDIHTREHLNTYLYSYANMFFQKCISCALIAQPLRVFIHTRHEAHWGCQSIVNPVTAAVMNSDSTREPDPQAWLLFILTTVTHPHGGILACILCSCEQCAFQLLLRQSRNSVVLFIVPIINIHVLVTPTIPAEMSYLMATSILFVLS